MSARQILDGTMSERDFQQLVLDAARLVGWHCFHAYDSRRSEPGFPDLVMVRGERVIAAELKTSRGRLGKRQAEWLEALAATGKIETFLWRPSDWPEIVRTLVEGTADWQSGRVA